MKRRWIIGMALVMAAWGCRREQDRWIQRTYWPMVRSEWRLTDMLPDSAVAADSGVVRLRSRRPVMRLRADQRLAFPDTAQVAVEKIGNLTLGNRTARTHVTLGQIARAMNDSVGNNILLNHGKLRFIDSFSNASSPPVDVDITDLFEEATFLSGTMTLRVTNRFKIVLEDLVLEIRNRSSGTVVLRDSIPFLDTGQTHLRSFDMAGMTVEGRLKAQMVRVSSPGTPVYPIVIDTNSALEFEVTTTGVRVQSATARFPAQYLVEDTFDAVYHLDPLEIEEVVYRSGFLTLGLEHTFPAAMRLEYEAPHLTKDGVPLRVTVSVPASPDGTARQDSVRIPLAGYRHDLRGRFGDSFNASYTIRRLWMDSTTQVVSLSADDSIRVFSSLRQPTAAMVRGYVGTDTFHFARSERADMPSFLQSVRFDQATVRWYFENAFGVDVMVRIDSVIAQKGTPPQRVPLQSAMVGVPINLPSGSAGHPASHLLELSPDNSNITELVNFHPEVWRVVGVSVWNVSEFPGLRNQQITDSDYFHVGMEYEIPLAVQIDGLTLVDTFSAQPFEAPADADARLHWEVLNDYPVTVQWQVYWWDSTADALIDSVASDGPVTIPAGQPFGPDGRVTQPSRIRGVVDLPPDRLRRQRNASHWIVRARITTPSNHGPVILYDDYRLRFTIYLETTTATPTN